MLLWSGTSEEGDDVTDLVTRPAEDYYTVEQLSAHLDVPVGTLRHWRQHGRGPEAVKIGKHLRYYKSDVETWLREQKGGRP
jgi:excisionase family DNA binding protein